MNTTQAMTKGEFLFAQQQAPQIDARKDPGAETPPVGIELRKLEDALCQLHSAISILSGRLAPVLTPAPEMDSGISCGSQTQPVRSPLANELSGYAVNCGDAAHRVRVLIDQLSI